MKERTGHIEGNKVQESVLPPECSPTTINFNQNVNSLNVSPLVDGKTKESLNNCLNFMNSSINMNNNYLMGSPYYQVERDLNYPHSSLINTPKLTEGNSRENSNYYTFNDLHLY